VNRLSANMPLACDATIIYAMKLAGRWNGNIRKADLRLVSPYNTYSRQGLPPGPIANPGVPSLRAALVPAKTDYLYYVSRNDGTHLFSRDYRSHMAAVAKYQKKLR
jgi:peptidoglycan lytic transglycosylase G